LSTQHLQADPKVDPEDLVDLLQLTERMCRWPVGDPKDGVFGFCGGPSVAGLPYCREHIAKAYQTSTKKGEKKIKKFVPVKVLDDDQDEGEVDDEDLENIDDLDPDEIDDMDDDDNTIEEEAL
jgi:hypothetical protein